MRDDNPHLRTALRSGAPEAPQPDEESGLPSPNERQYVPHARPANNPIYSIHFVNPKGEVRSFQYVHLDSNSSFSAECISLKFLGMEPVKVIIRGRNLWCLYDYLHQHRIPWIMEAARDFAQDGQTIVTQIGFTTVTHDERNE
jgi:hypothetical protein